MRISIIPIRFKTVPIAVVRHTIDFQIDTARVLVSVAYMPERTAQEELNLFHERLSR